MRRSTRGFTLIEVIVVSGIMAFMLASIGAMCICTMRSYDRATARTFTDTDAALAMGRIVSRVREARRIKLLADGSKPRLRIICPKTVEGYDYYDRYKDDTQNQFDYYLSDSTGVPGHDGTWLWEGKNNNNRRSIVKNISSLDFETDPDPNYQNYVKITIIARESTSTVPIETKLTQRVVYLRNF